MESDEGMTKMAVTKNGSGMRRCNLVLFVGLLAVSMTLAGNIWVVTTHSVGWIALAALGLIIGIGGISSRLHLSDRQFAGLLFILAFLAKGWLAWVLKTPLESDFKVFYDAAVQVAGGHLDLSASSYFRVWPYQIGIVLYYAAIIKAMGPDPRILLLANGVFMAGTHVLIYRIARQMVPAGPSRYIALLYLVYPAPYFLASVLTNQHASNFFLLAGVWLYLVYRGRWPGMVAAVMLIAVGDVLRPQGILIMGALVAAELVHGWGSREKLQLGLRMAVLLGLFVALTAAASAGVRISGIHDLGLANGFPEYKLVVGLNPETQGMYSAADADILLSISDRDLRKATALTMIRERLTDPRQVLTLMVQKQKKMWWDEDSTFDWGMGYLVNQPVGILGVTMSYWNFKVGLLRLEKAIYLWVVFLMWLTMMGQWRKVRISPAVMVSLMLVLGSLAVYALIEIQPRYRDLTVIAFFLLAAEGYAGLTQQLSGWMTGWKRSAPKAKKRPAKSGFARKAD
jgi:hypothetical protein